MKPPRVADREWQRLAELKKLARDASEELWRVRSSFGLDEYDRIHLRLCETCATSSSEPLTKTTDLLPGDCEECGCQGAAEAHFVYVLQAPWHRKPTQPNGEEKSK